MVIIGITGGTGTGKTTVLGVFGSRGAYTIDADATYHRLLRESSEMLAAIEARFPGVAENGVLDTKALGRRVFGNAKALSDLGRITHAYVLEDIALALDAARRAGYAFAAMDAVALFESSGDRMCHKTVGVLAPTELRAARISARDGITADYAASRIAAQKPDSFYRGRCDYILVNDGDIVAFERNAFELFDKIRTENVNG